MNIEYTHDPRLFSHGDKVVIPRSTQVVFDATRRVSDHTTSIRGWNLVWSLLMKEFIGDGLVYRVESSDVSGVLLRTEEEFAMPAGGGYDYHNRFYWPSCALEHAGVQTLDEVFR